jgi:hypothetical protein
VANTQTSPLDATGHAAEKAAKARVKEQQARAQEISLATAAEEESLKKDVFDPKHPDKPIVLDEIENVGVTTANNTVVIRTITDIKDMTYGVGNHYTFDAGKKYRVPVELAAYLEQLGYIWRPN